MADPVTIGLMVVGTLVSAVGAIQQGQAAAAAARTNAEIADRNAKVARATAAQDAETKDRENRLRLGAIIANYGASGVSMAGTPLDVLGDSARQAEFEKQTILYKGDLRAMGFEDSASLDRANAKAAKRAGYFKAGSALLSGAGNIAGGLGTPTAATAPTGIRVDAAGRILGGV